MLTELHIKNFKKISDIHIELGQSVVFIGPNNSGKTTALQALALWAIGSKRWYEKRANASTPEKRPGITINRKDLISIPVPNANLLWNDLHVRNKEKNNGKQVTQNVCIEITLTGITKGKQWSCGLEFDYANTESFYCRLLKTGPEKQDRMPYPPEAASINIAYLPPMSGLAAVEPKWEPGRINVLLGEGQTAQVLRNLCFQLYERVDKELWNNLIEKINTLFGVELSPPKYLNERGEIIMNYKNENNIELDISSSGRGLQQTLLLLAHLYTNPSTVLLLDEPDAHLEVLRQRHIYQLLTEAARSQNSQFIAASHSEVVLEEAASRDMVIAFVGTPHRIDDRGSQVLKSLKEIGYDQYYLAEQRGWVLYLEGSTDLAILQGFAEILNHPVLKHLERPFVHYVGNQPQKANDHFFGLKEAKPNLTGCALFDRLERGLPPSMGMKVHVWKKREIENYLCFEDVLLRYAEYYGLSDDLFDQPERNKRVQIMNDCINELSMALETLGKPSPWSIDTKVSDEFLTPLFQKYFQKIGLPNEMQKTNYHQLTKLVKKEQIDKEVIEQLDMILSTAEQAAPVG